MLELDDVRSKLFNFLNVSKGWLEMIINFIKTIWFVSLGLLTFAFIGILLLQGINLLLHTDFMTDFLTSDLSDSL